MNPNIKEDLGGGSYFHIMIQVCVVYHKYESYANFKLEATKLECPGARACETNGFVEKLPRITSEKKLPRIATQPADLGLHALLYYSHLAPISSA